MTDIFKGGQVALIGRYKNSSDLKNIVLTLRGKSGKETKNYNFSDLDFPLRSEQNDFLPRLWASRRVGWLIEQIRANGETKELRDEVTELGTRYGIVTPYTSYLATDGSYRQFEGADDRARAVMSAPAAKAMRAKNGALAVQQSVQQNTMQSNMSVYAGKKEDAEKQVLVQNSASSQFVGNKNFQNQNNVWVDADYSDTRKLPEVNIKFGSDEYFALVGREPSLAQYLALGQQVVVVWKNKVYRITQ